MYATDTGGKPCRVRSHYWSDADEEAAQAACAAADAAFALFGRAIPCDYPFALSQAVLERLPWLASVPDAGLRLAFGAESGNGWQRHEGNGAPIYIARRTRLILRLPVERLEMARALSGSTLAISGFPLSVGAASVLALSPADTLYALHVADESGDEEIFLERTARAIEALGVRRRKIMCGKSRRLATSQGTLHTRSVLVAGLAPRDSLALLTNGIGIGRLLGCGIFVPYKRSDSPARTAWT